jgi:carbamate kinase
LAVVAFGGNALITADDHGTAEEQKGHADEAAEWMVRFIDHRHDLVVVHGNGPQVGQVLIQMEEGATKVPPSTLDVAVAQTEGSMGFLLETALRNRFRREGSAGREVTTLLTLVVVDREDPGFSRPTKPIGPFFSRWRAEALKRDHGWDMVEDAGRGWRKVVASPRPVEALGVAAMRSLLDLGHVVIAGGGGGIPVIRQPDGQLAGCEAVIDKDLTSALLARQLGADLLIVLTTVPQVMRDFGTRRQRPLPELRLAEARRLLAQGHFPPGSMGPKMEAAIEFVAATGNRVLITDIESLPAAMDGKTGTVVLPDTGRGRRPSSPAGGAGSVLPP